MPCGLKLAICCHLHSVIRQWATSSTIRSSFWVLKACLITCCRSSPWKCSGVVYRTVGRLGDAMLWMLSYSMQCCASIPRSLNSWTWSSMRRLSGEMTTVTCPARNQVKKHSPRSVGTEAHWQQPRAVVLPPNKRPMRPRSSVAWHVSSFLAFIYKQHFE